MTERLQHWFALSEKGRGPDQSGGLVLYLQHWPDASGGRGDVCDHAFFGSDG